MIDTVTTTLPSGRRVRVSSAGGGSPISDDRVDGVPTFGGRFVNAIKRGLVRVEEARGRGFHPLDLAALRELSLPDWHALRDLAYRVGAITVDDAGHTCRNCDAPLAVTPEAAPIDDLDTWYVSGAELPSFAQPVAFASPLSTPSGKARDFVIRPVTAAVAEPLWRALLRRRRPPIDEHLVRALGIERIGVLRDPRRIASVLRRAPDPALDLIETAFLMLAYSPRGYFPLVCRRCGAVHDVPAPVERELEVDDDALARLFDEDAMPAQREPVHAPFPDLEQFEALVHTVGEEVYRDRGVRYIDLVVHDGPADLDGSGEPLLGSYQPVAPMVAGDSNGAFVITLYYRTFRRMFEEEPYDVESEVRETIDHEVEHHLYFLAGHDPMDEEEREEALEELKRTFGERAVRRARLADALAEARHLVIFLVVLAAAFGLFVLVLELAGVL